MARTFVLGSALAVALAAAGGAAGQDDYGYGTPSPPASTSPPPAAGGATTAAFRAPLSAAHEVPKPVAPAGAKGMFTATVTTSGASATLRWKLTFGGLSGPAVAAHVHRGKAGKAGPVLLPLCGPCRSGQKGAVALPKAARRAIESGGTYVNVHTAANEAGEVRGQLRARA
jgi:hypothetical protein